MQFNNFQRIGCSNNASVGRAFEAKTQAFFATQGIHLTPCLGISVGVGNHKKLHRFDLANEDPPILVECKSHTWTQSGNMPSAKVTVWNEAMYYFHVAPSRYRKVMFVLKDCHPIRGITLASYYLEKYAHLIPQEVEIWEYDPLINHADRIR